MAVPKPLNTQAWMPIKKLALLAVGKVAIKAAVADVGARDVF
jgi:hypothetical protein